MLQHRAQRWRPSCERRCMRTHTFMAGFRFAAFGRTTSTGPSAVAVSNTMHRSRPVDTGSPMRGCTHYISPAIHGVSTAYDANRATFTYQHPLQCRSWRAPAGLELPIVPTLTGSGAALDCRGEHPVRGRLLLHHLCERRRHLRVRAADHDRVRCTVTLLHALAPCCALHIQCGV